MSVNIPPSIASKIAQQVQGFSNFSDLNFNYDNPSKQALAAYALQLSGIPLEERFFSGGGTVTLSALHEILKVFDEEADQLPSSKYESAKKIILMIGGDISDIGSAGGTVTRKTWTQIVEHKNRLQVALPKHTKAQLQSMARFPTPDPKIGRLGEEFVLEFEKKRLTDGGFPDLAKKVADVSKLKCGYDIFSYDFAQNKSPLRCIEVKTTKRDLDQKFFITRNELNSSKRLHDRYWLYRVYNFKDGKGDIKCIQGDLNQFLDLTPETHSAKKMQSVN